ncbi:MAG: ribosome biogenesis GTPase Der [Christensenellaceae bacterium]|jgi:GTP-binding protein|nr:ribosome biogenesis GTPase Der [Christensenellaceae bacterium]
MRNKPIVAVVGRPNVGKSTFFNKMAGARIAIVEDTPGVTRDRVYADVSWQNDSFTLVDTGGIDPFSTDPLLTQMREQAAVAIETADAILFFVDGREGIVGADHEVASLLRRAKKPVLLVVNKIDSPMAEAEKLDFYALGIGEPMTISSVNLLGIGDLLEELCKLLPKWDEGEEEGEEPVKIAVVGKPNVGKSSLVNTILGESRVMVSDIAGTTRDAIDSPFEADGKHYTIIDTAGIRRKAKIEDRSLERYSVIRALGAIRRCDVALVLLNAQDGVTEQDQRVAGYVREEGKACVVVVNKWDLIEKETGTLEAYSKALRNELKFLDYAKIAFISAKTGQRVGRLMPLVDEAYENAARRIPTGVLNDALHEAITVTPPPSDRGRRLRIYYATQVSTKPPSFVLFVNSKELFHYSYERYIENHFRKSFLLEGTPIRILVRERGEKED